MATSSINADIEAAIGSFCEVTVKSNNGNTCQRLLGFLWNFDPETELVYLFQRSTKQSMLEGKQDESYIAKIIRADGLTSISKIDTRCSDDSNNVNKCEFWNLLLGKLKEIETLEVDHRKIVQEDNGTSVNETELAMLRKRDLLRHLSLNRIPHRSIDDTTIEVLSGAASICYPFQRDDISSVNEIVLSRLHSFMNDMSLYKMEEVEKYSYNSNDEEINNDIESDSFGIIMVGPNKLITTKVVLEPFSQYHAISDAGKKEVVINLRPSFVEEKYWDQRYRLFSRFDRGIKLDQESWYSVTPEVIAEHVAERCRCEAILDVFCGSGGNAIQFAYTCERVFAIDIDESKLENAKHNAKIYGVDDRIEFIQGNAIEILQNGYFKDVVDVVFMSPPWGGPSYSEKEVFDLHSVQLSHGHQTIDLFDLVSVAFETSPNVAYFLPRNVNQVQCAQIKLGKCKEVEVEHHVINERVKTCVAYYGDFLISESER